MAGRLEICEAAVAEALLAEPEGCLPATELLALFSPADEFERQKLTIAISRVCEMVPKHQHNGQPVFRLRKMPAHTARGTGASRGSLHADKASDARRGSQAASPVGATGTPRTPTSNERTNGRTHASRPKAFAPPLSISSSAVIDLLSAAPDGWMEASKLRALFHPRGEAERQELTVAIAEVADLEYAPVGKVLEHINEKRLVGVLRLKPQFKHAERTSSRSSSRPASVQSSPQSAWSPPLPPPAQLGGAHPNSKPPTTLGNGVSSRQGQKSRPIARPTSPATRGVNRHVVSPPAGLVPSRRSAPAARNASKAGGHVATGPPPPAKAQPVRSTPRTTTACSSASRKMGGAQAVKRCEVVDEPPPTAEECARVNDALASCAGGRVRADGLVALFAPQSEHEKRRLALAVAAVARVVEVDEGSGRRVSYFIPRSAASPQTKGSHDDEEDFPWMNEYDDDQPRATQPPDRDGDSTAGVSDLAKRVTVEGAFRRQEPRRPLQVSLENVRAVLLDHGGRMRSDALIAFFGPLATGDRRKLSDHVRAQARVLLPVQPGAPGIVVLREVLAREAAEAHAATTVQVRVRWQQRHRAIARAVAAGRLQTAVRNRNERARRDAARAAARAAMRQREERANKAATVLQGRARAMSARTVMYQLKRARLLANETPEERTAREAAERSKKLRAKLRERKRGEGVAIAAREQVREEGTSYTINRPNATPSTPPPRRELVAGESLPGASLPQSSSRDTKGDGPRRDVHAEAEAARLELRRIVDQSA